MKKPRIGIALGSGAARGWAHIGVLAELERIGIKPDVVCGTSIGALVGGTYLTGNLANLEATVRELSPRAMFRLLDVSLASGGLITGDRLVELVHSNVGDLNVEELDRPFAAVAADLETGREVWLREGSLFDAIRASISFPGIFTPFETEDGRWLVDGGLVNPVPSSVCRALGAQVVIAVNLNSDIVGQRFAARRNKAIGKAEKESSKRDLWETLMSRLSKRHDEDDSPSFFDVLAGSIHIMQDRITRSRMAGDPPDVVLSPRLGQIRLMDYDRGAEAIEAGRACVESSTKALKLAIED